MELELKYEAKKFKTIDDNNYTDLKKCVIDIVKKEGYVKYNISKNVTTEDSSFLGILCEVKIEGETATTKKETNLFLKVIVPNAQITIISLPESFKRELFFYKDIAPIFAELQNEMNIPIEQRYKTVKFYEESNPNVIILENMTKRGFKTNFRMDLITLQYSEMAIRELAKFHALSFAMESKRPKYFERKIKTISHPFSLDKDWEGFVQNMCEITLNYLDGESRRKLLKLIPSFNEKYRKYFEGTTRKRCLRHGDYRPSNILMRENDGQILEMIPIDYQIISYSYPILDFFYFIFPTTDRNFRRAHLTHLKDLYYDTLESFLKHFSLDVNNIYCRLDFEQDFKEMLDFGLINAINVVPFLMVNEDDVPDITKEPLAGISFGLDKKCKDRLVGIVEDFIDWDYL